VLAFVLLRAWPNFFAIVGALLCAGIAWLLRPRIFQPVEGQIARTQYPTLYHVVDQIASHLGAPPIHSIIITEQFNAAFGKTGWRQRNTLFLGLPLFTILAPQERVALIAHELAHSINGDVSRGTLVGTAIDTLQGWRGLLQAHPSAAGGDKLLAAALNPVIALMLVAAWSAKMGALVLAHLLWHDSQRAEYLADALAATVSSTPAMLSCLEKLHFAALFDQAVQTTALNAQARNVFDELALLIAALPARELLRIQRLQQLQSSRLDTTHPPTAYRIARLKSHPIPIAKYSCTDEESARMDQEFHPLRARVQRALVDGYRQQLYY
jgi:heat shock protein HtpX